uniref:Uncharacterized protein n=1 Tax=mine drainage metagenome TaxID=410659 RepID=E6PWM6_9ZZZZ
MGLSKPEKVSYPPIVFVFPIPPTHIGWGVEYENMDGPPG